MDDDRISLAHGNGGRFMRELIEEIFARHLGRDELDTQADAVPIALNGGEVLITTDGFTVQPLEFPGGDIGSLAVHGTTNDLAVAGARPLYLTLNAFIEEGFEIATLDRIVASLARAARESGVRITAGDTKVLRRGEGGGLYLATTGVGVRLPGVVPSLARIRDGDVILVSGPVGDHGTAVMLAREDFGLRGDLVSDAGPVMALTESLLAFDGCASCATRPAAASPPLRTRSTGLRAWVCASSPRYRSAIRCRRSATCSATIPTTWLARDGCWRSWRRTRPTLRWPPGASWKKARTRRGSGASPRRTRA